MTVLQYVELGECTYANGGLACLATGSPLRVSPDAVSNLLVLPPNTSTNTSSATVGGGNSSDFFPPDSTEGASQSNNARSQLSASWGCLCRLICSLPRIRWLRVRWVRKTYLQALSAACNRCTTTQKPVWHADRPSKRPQL